MSTGSSSPNLLSHFRFGQTWSETNTLQIVLDSFCVHSHTYAPSTSPREALLAWPPSPSWNLASFTVESILSSPCPHSNFPLSCQGGALAHLDSLPSHDLVLWTDGSVPFPFGRGSSGILANCSLCGTEPLFPFQQVQFV